MRARALAARTMLGVALVVVSAGIMVARSANGDLLLSTTAVGGNPLAMAVDEQSGRGFVINNHDNTVSILDTATGALLRTVPVGSGPLALAVDKRTDRVFVTNNEARSQSQVGLAMYCCPGAASSVTVLNARSGAILRTVPVGVSPLAAAVDEHTSRVFVANYGDGTLSTVSVLDAHSGQVLHTVPLGGSPHLAQEVAVDERAGHAFVTLENGSDRGSVVILDATTGRILRTVTVGQAPGSLAVDERAGRVFVLNQSSNSVSVLDSYSGAVVGTTQLGAGLFALAVDERTGRVFVATDDNSVINGNTSMLRGSVCVLDALSGRLLRTITVGDLPAAVAVDERSGHVFVVNRGVVDSDDAPTGNGSVSVLDADSGTVLHTNAVGMDPRAVAVDVRRGRAFVVTGGGMVRKPESQWLQGVRHWVPWFAEPAPLVRPSVGTVSVLDATR